MKYLLWAINTIIYGVIFAGLLNVLGFHGYFAGYYSGAFIVIFYYVGIMILVET